MIKETLITLGLLFLVMMANAAPIRDEQALTVLVTSEGFGPSGRGTGLILDEKHILTCAHMLHTKKDVFFVYTYPLGNVIKANAEYADSDKDLAILVLEKPIVIVAYPRFETHWTEGDTVTVIGNMLGSMGWIVSKGVISGRDGDAIVSDVRINHGNSGGPWFDDDGSVIALSDWLVQPEQGPGISGGISAATIEQFLEDRSNAEKMSAMMGKLLGI